jgi:FkbH-like protein
MINTSSLRSTPPAAGSPAAGSPAADSPAALVRAVRQLALPAADGEAIERLAAALKRVDLSGVPGLVPLRVQILANITTDYLADHLRLMLIRGGFGAGVTAGHYGALVRGLFGEADLMPATCDAAVLVLTHRDLQFPPRPGMSDAEARALVAREADFWVPLLERSRVPTAILSFDLPAHRVLDEQDGLAPGGLGWHVKMTNLEIAARLPATVAWVDAEALQFRVGAAHWDDERLYHLCKQPFAMEALPEIAHTLAAALAGLFGRSRKVLVLDLDNTLWGGVVGDDGLQGIILGPESAEGEAFASFQTYARNLAQRGVILAVCSKNREEVARAPFREHSGMILKEEDIACFVANFEDKAAGLRHIARTLNVGLDSLVFVDDNPVERTLIRAELPDVLVIELPDEPAYYARAVEAAKAFPLRSLTREDLGRGASYRAMAAVRDLGAAPGTDMDAFLIGLEPTVHVEKIDATTVDRIVQLIRKTNQFKLNLTGFQESEILAAAAEVVALRLVDRLQDYGIVAIAVTAPAEGTLSILNWVMSCRVFGRRLEQAMLEILCGNARTRGCAILAADYTPTEKNVILPDILAQLGFLAADGAGRYRRPAGAASSLPHHMTVIDRR